MYYLKMLCKIHYALGKKKKKNRDRWNYRKERFMKGIKGIFEMEETDGQSFSSSFQDKQNLEWTFLLKKIPIYAFATLRIWNDVRHVTSGRNVWFWNSSNWQFWGTLLGDVSKKRETRVCTILNIEHLIPVRLLHLHIQCF